MGLARLGGELGLLRRATDLRSDGYLEGLDDRQARQWLTLRDAYRPALSSRARPDVRTLAWAVGRAAAHRAGRLLPGWR